MRPWAKWLINHNMRWVLYVICVACFPLYLFALVGEARDAMCRELRAIANEAKNAEAR